MPLRAGLAKKGRFYACHQYFLRPAVVLFTILLAEPRKPTIILEGVPYMKNTSTAAIPNPATVTKATIGLQEQTRLRAYLLYLTQQKAKTAIA